MNIKRDVANRALLKCGQTPLTDEDIENNAVLWRVIKSFYLSTILESLAEFDWTCCKKRSALHLVDTAETENLSTFSFAYALPVDLSKPLEIEQNALFRIEGNVLYTNIENAHLLYISNGKISAEEDYLLDDDYPDYKELLADCIFWQFLETRLAAKMVLNTTGDLNLYNLLFQESQITARAASITSHAAARSKRNPQKYWYEGEGETY